MNTVLEGMSLMLVARFFVLVFFAILFLQSSLDKIFDRKGNLDYFAQQFSKSPLKNFSALLLSVMLLLEFSSGIFCLLGSAVIWIDYARIGVIGLLLSCLSLLCLFFGQRLAKDYAGAVSIATYFVLAILGLVLFS